MFDYSTGDDFEWFDFEDEDVEDFECEVADELPLYQAYNAWCEEHRMILRDDSVEYLALEASRFLADQAA